MGRKRYVLGTGLSHNGSAVLLEDGRVKVGIEKERLTRLKHDGGNDALAVQYCLDAAGIDIHDVELVVQCGMFTVPDRDHHEGRRVWSVAPDVRVVSVSHHLAHVYSAIGTAPFDDFNVLVVDGCGSPRPFCVEPLDGIDLSLSCDGDLVAEKDSFYRWSGSGLQVLAKDFSDMADRYLYDVRLPSTSHSIGGFYAALSKYCVGGLDDSGKLMGLSPFGRQPGLEARAFRWIDDRLHVTTDWRHLLRRPWRSYGDLVERFEYFADLALWAQREVEDAVSELVRRRSALTDDRPLALSGGVGLNALANSRVIESGLVPDLYVEPAAGDNGIALGCAFYGWLEILGQERRTHDRSTCFGRRYERCEIAAALDHLDGDDAYRIDAFDCTEDLVEAVAAALHQGLVVGWFQDGSEFGPRALGRRSILAHPGIDGLRDHINHNLKFREDFRPFAPSTPAEAVDAYFVHGYESPYMILVDQVREEWVPALSNVMHVDQSARVQTVEEAWNPRYHALLRAFEARSGIPVLLNTSFNKRGQPIVETPTQAVALFEETAMDMVVIDTHVVRRSRSAAGQRS